MIHQSKVERKYNVEQQQQQRKAVLRDGTLRAWILFNEKRYHLLRDCFEKFLEHENRCRANDVIDKLEQIL